MFDASLESAQEASRPDGNAMFDSKASPATKAPILVVMHQEQSTAGRIGRLLEARGHRLDVRRPRFGDSLPQTMAGHAGAVVFGGPMSANDPDPYIREEIDWIGVSLREEKPFLGVCLGGQMLALLLGARVYRDPVGRGEIGYYPIQPTSAGHALCAAPFPGRVYQWHREGFDLPRGATELATGDAFPVQAFRYGGSAFGLQFHPEVTYAMICRWTTRAAERMDAVGAQPPVAHREGWYQFDRAIDLWIGEFVDRWLATPASVETPAPEFQARSSRAAPRQFSGYPA